MPKFIMVTEVADFGEDVLTRRTLINADQIIWSYDGIEEVGAYIELTYLEEPLAVAETPEEILALIEGRPLPKAPVGGGDAMKIVLASPMPVATGNQFPQSPGDAI